ncbi:MAG: Lrp/AsnC family transcriptional regulator [Acidipropionibacterium sp.]|jgi:Lrp/AsnC family leucine-responsive transcriptional regulator|nr:Lrp/AsnC family transcriptional regulator [Acidipropionibacterium sp.]
MPRGDGLDGQDRRLLAALAADGRAKLSALAEMTGLSVSTVQTRVRRLEEIGAITGYRAVVAPSTLGCPLAAFVEVYADPGMDDAVPAELEAIPQVQACWTVAGDATHLMLVRVRDAAELDRVLTRIRSAVHTRTRTTMVLRSHFDRVVAPDPEVP